MNNEHLSSVAVAGQPDTLFPLPEEPEASKQPEARSGAPRVLKPDREQARFMPVYLEQLLPGDHQARLVWHFVQQLDLSELYAKIRSVAGGPGRDAIDPRLLLALWLYATLDGVGSARELERLCDQHNAYQWLCGGVSVNHHTLSDFRTGLGDALEKYLVHSVAVLRERGLVDLNRVAQDGMRVRASAGSPSFRRRATLERYVQEAQEQVARLRKEMDEDPAANHRQQQAKARAARERLERVQEALQQLPLVEASKKKQRKDATQARVSTTDPEARVMKMPNGGFNPAFNVQFATDTKSQVIVGVDVTNQGSDQGLLEPMVEQITEQHGTRPKEALVDGGFASLDDIEKLSTGPTPCTVFMPPPEPRSNQRQANQARADDSPAVAAWRERMATPEGKAIYKERASTAECVNAQARNRGLQRFLVRGLIKVRCIALWYALAHNFSRLSALRILTLPPPK